jgi:peptidoglycan/xylan/chitin deacetylase (PgdA/CDA1 family)
MQTALLPDSSRNVSHGNPPGGSVNPPPQQEPSANDPPPPSNQPADPPADPPPSDPVPPLPDPVISCKLLSDCIDAGKASVSSFKGGKRAAASYTFDDNVITAFDIADLFEARGLRASFYIVPGTMPDDRWPRYKDLNARGHEIGNHSMTHTIDLGLPDTTPAQMTTEIVDAQRLMTDKLGFTPLVFAFPWHSSTPDARALALKTHIAIRTSTDELPFTMAFFDQDHGGLDAALTTANQQLAATVAARGWFVAAGHGIDGQGWSPVTRQFLNDHLDYAKSFAADLWTDTFVNVARYQICRKQATVEVTPVSSQQLKLKLSGSFAAACTEPLTMKIPSLVSGIPAVVARDASGVLLQTKKINGALTVDVMPGQTVTLETVQ